MSQSKLASCIPMPIEHRALSNVIEKAKDWALMHGVGMRDKKQFSKDAMQASEIKCKQYVFTFVTANKIHCIRLYTER